MKKIAILSACFTVVIFMLQSCVKDHLQKTYTYFVPVYKEKTEVLREIKSAQPQALKWTGKIFLYGNYIFINELNRGVHIIDNSNPSAPRNLSFIPIPGNVDIAVKDKILYADLFTDMLAIDIANPANPVLKKVVNAVFPERNYENGFMPDSTKYIVDWTRKETTDKIDMDASKAIGVPGPWYSLAQNSAAAGPVAGVSGSMARFTIINDYLYTVGRSSLTTFDISSPAGPVAVNVQNPGWNIETIYPLKDVLFIGSQTGMFIYNLSDPSAPALQGSFSHACYSDPVIADSRYAYITLRATTDVSFCWGTPVMQNNELDIVDISNLSQPRILKAYQMSGPKGLSKDGDHLFICDGEAGLKVYDAADVMNLQLLQTISTINPSDVICQNGVALVVADEGLYQFDYSNINQITLVSKIPVEPHD
jgi:hypothetical protein